MPGLVTKEQIMQALGGGRPPLPLPPAQPPAPATAPSPEDPAERYGSLLRLSSDPNVPEAIRVSAQDAAARHRELARKAGTSPWAYKAGGEVAEDNGYLKATPREQRVSQSFPVGVGAPGGLEALSSPAAADSPGDADPGPFRSTPAEQRHAAFSGRVDRMNEALMWPFKKLGEMVSDSHYDPERQELVANKTPSLSLGKPPAQAEEPPDAPAAGLEAVATPAERSPGPGAGARGAPVPVPVSKPGDIPAAPARSRARSEAPAAAAPAPAALPARLSSPEPQGLEAAVSRSGSTGGSNPDTPPAYKPDAPKPDDTPKMINPLAFALIKGGAALMASDKPFGEALGDGIGAGLGGYVDAQQIGIDRANDAARQRREDAREGRETYRDTVLAPWEAGQRGNVANRELDIRTLDSDRQYNLGERGLDLKATDSDRDYELGQRRVGLEGARLGLEGQRLGLEGEQLDIARQNLEPSDMRMLNSLAGRFKSLDPRITDAEAFQLAVEQYKQIQPQGISGLAGLGALLGGGQQEIPDGAIGGAIR